MTSLRPRLLAALLLLPALLAPEDAVGQRVTARGALGLSNASGDLDIFDPATTWEVELRVRPTSLVSLGGGRRELSRELGGDDVTFSAWFIEPRFHADVGDGGLGFYLALRGTFGTMEIDRAAAGSDSAHQLEIGPGLTARLGGGRLAIDAGLLVGREEAGEFQFPTPLPIGSGTVLSARAGVAIGIW